MTQSLPLHDKQRRSAGLVLVRSIGSDGLFFSDGASAAIVIWLLGKLRLTFRQAYFDLLCKRNEIVVNNTVREQAIIPIAPTFQSNSHVPIFI